MERVLPVHDPEPRAQGVSLLFRTWNDGEALMIRQLLATYDIPCQVVSDVPHTVLPICVDGLGEVRILVAPSHLEWAKRLLAEHRRQGLELLAGGRSAPKESPDAG